MRLSMNSVGIPGEFSGKWDSFGWFRVIWDRKRLLRKNSQRACQSIAMNEMPGAVMPLPEQVIW